MKTAYIRSYWQKTYATWDQEKFKWVETTTKPIEEKELKIEYSSATFDMEEIKIIGGPIRTKTFLIKHLLRPPEGNVLISLGVVNKFPEVWVKWEDLNQLIEGFKNGN